MRSRVIRGKQRMNNNGQPEVRAERGFTLIEVMIVVVVIGILAAIAYPSYTRYVQDTHRAEAQVQIMEFAGALESYKAANFSYRGATVGALAPPELANSQYYNVALTPAVLQHEYTITASPVGMMAGTETLTWNSSGESSWD